MWLNHNRSQQTYPLPITTFLALLFVIVAEFLESKICLYKHRQRIAELVGTDFVVTGTEPGPKKLETLKQLMQEGHEITRIYEEQLIRILGGY